MKLSHLYGVLSLFTFLTLCRGTTRFITINEANVDYTIQSPNYPSDYGNDEDEEWYVGVSGSLSTDQNLILMLIVDEFRLEYHSSCIYDSFKVQSYDGYATEAEWCGEDAPRTYTASQVAILLEFRSDGSITSSGFSIRLRVIDLNCPYTELPAGHADRVYLTQDLSSSGEAYCHTFGLDPYSCPGTSCKLQIDVEDLKTSRADACLSDALIIYDESNPGTEIARFCGNSNPSGYLETVYTNVTLMLYAHSSDRLEASVIVLPDYNTDLADCIGRVDIRNKHYNTVLHSLEYPSDSPGNGDFCYGVVNSAGDKTNIVYESESPIGYQNYIKVDKGTPMNRDTTLESYDEFSEFSHHCFDTEELVIEFDSYYSYTSPPFSFEISADGCGDDNAGNYIAIIGGVSVAVLFIMCVCKGKHKQKQSTSPSNAQHTNAQVRSVPSAPASSNIPSGQPARVANPTSTVGAGNKSNAWSPIRPPSYNTAETYSASYWNPSFQAEVATSGSESARPAGVWSTDAANSAPITFQGLPDEPPPSYSSLGFHNDTGPRLASHNAQNIYREANAQAPPSIAMPVPPPAWT